MTSFISGNFAADGQSDPIIIDRRGVVFIGDTTAEDLGGGEVVVQFQSPTGAWSNSQNSAVAANVMSVDIALPTHMRLSLGGSTSPDLNYSLVSDRNTQVDALVEPS